MTHPAKDKESCILYELAAAMAEDDALKAVWLDAQQKKVSFAFEDGAETEKTRTRLEAIVSHHQPEKLPDCAHDPWKVDCLLCDLGRSRAMPPGIQLLTMPDAGIMLQKEAATSRRVLRWQQFEWLMFRPREVELPSPESDLEEWRHDMIGAAVCGVTALGGILIENYAPQYSDWARGLFVIAYLSGGWHAAVDVWERLKKRTLDVHFLMLAVAVGAAAIGHWSEGAILLFLFSFSGALEELAMARTEREIRSLFHAAPKEANVIDPQGKETKLPVDNLTAGVMIRVRPGELFPVDAEVVTGATSADESNLTGESIPVEKKTGDSVLGGTMNQWGSVDCRVLKAAQESALTKIIRLIQEAQRSKAPSQKFTDNFGTTYTYAVLFVTLAMFFVWWKGFGIPAFHDVVREGAVVVPSSFYRAMTLLVVASPCALVLSIPSAILAGIAAGARRGVLFRGGAAIEKLAAINRVALDKTGTLTTGLLQVVGVETWPAGQEDRLLGVAGALSHHSAHPVSRAISAECRRRTMDPGDVTDFRSLTGMGVEGKLSGGETARIGRRSLFPDAAWLAGVPLPEIGSTETIVESGALHGRLLFRDEVRAQSAPLIKKLQAQGIKVVMLTGDRPEAANQVAEHLGLDEVDAGLSPEQKVARIVAWSKAGEKVAMVGDGVNDAPSLAAAHVAVGMGFRGSDAALEQSDVVLMQDKLENFLFAYRLSQRARRVIRQNLAISLGVIAILVASALGSFIPLTVGVIGHEGSTVIVVMNSLRLLFRRASKDSLVD